MYGNVLILFNKYKKLKALTKMVEGSLKETKRLINN
jgi:hypothetical protein